jgi:LAS superfamily LD-carboxypeptidase LdcB
MKQFVLFLDKACRNEGNLSLASRSLAPPGYSYHCVGDFDVGQVGLGAMNFTARFAFTEVFRQLQDLGYVRLRYGRDNMLGVRYEPWHVKVVAES